MIVGNAGGPYTTFQGAVDVHQKELHGNVVNELYHFHTGTDSTLSVAVSSGDTAITLADATGFAIGNAIQINNSQIETTFPIITALPGGNVLTLDRPLDFDYDISDLVEVVTTDLRTTIGSLASPIIYQLKPESGRIWFITRLILGMTHAAAATDDKFGDQTALTNGVVLRTFVNDQFESFTNWKTNGDIILDMFNVTYSDKAGPSLFGTSGRQTFTRLGVGIKLNGDNNDVMDIMIQDDLTGLTSFFLNGQGYSKAA